MAYYTLLTESGRGATPAADVNTAGTAVFCLAAGNYYVAAGATTASHNDATTATVNVAITTTRTTSVVDVLTTTAGLEVVIFQLRGSLFHKFFYLPDNMAVRIFLWESCCSCMREAGGAGVGGRTGTRVT